MASDGMDNLRQESWPPLNPWNVVLAGLGAAFLALFLYMLQGRLPDRVLIPLRGLAITGSLILAGGGVSLRLRTASWEFEERVVSAALTGLASFTALLGWLALDRDAWDSIALFLGVVVFVGFVGCVLILLPRGARRVVAVLLVALHFGGILSAITSAPPPGTTPPWITQVVWTYVYRPYVQFTYLNNAYHFYSPEPGPAQQLWLYIKFEDGTGEWLKIPQRQDYATRQEYQRILSITENANGFIQTQFSADASMYRRREMAGYTYHPSIKAAPANDFPLIVQYRRPTGMVKRTVESYAQHVAVTYHSDAHPVHSVKVYRVQHNIVPPQLMANEQVSPDDPTFFMPYFMGEFDREGTMITETPEFNSEGTLIKPGDPFLYWLIPILYEPKAGAKPSTLPAKEKDQLNRDKFEIVDYCKLHAEGHSGVGERE